MATNNAGTVVSTNGTTAYDRVDDTSKLSSSLRTELIGHVSVLLMSLLGIAMYSATYSVSMAVGASSKRIPVLEYWVSFSHLTCTVLCIIIQFIVGGIMRIETGLLGIAEAQVAVFLGIACACTVLSTECIAGDANVCAIYFPSAVYAPAAGVGLIVWSWIIYLSSLGCLRSSIGAFSLGTDGIGGVVVSCVMVMLPSQPLAAIVSICGRRGLPAGVCSGIDDSCGSVLISVLTWLSVGIIVIAGSLRKWRSLVVVGLLVQLVGSLLLIFTCALVLDASVASLAYRMTSMCFALYTCLESIVLLCLKISNYATITTTTTTAVTQKQMQKNR